MLMATHGCSFLTYVYLFALPLTLASMTGTFNFADSCPSGCCCPVGMVTITENVTSLDASISATDTVPANCAGSSGLSFSLGTVGARQTVSALTSTNQDFVLFRTTDNQFIWQYSGTSCTAGAVCVSGACLSSQQSSRPPYHSDGLTGTFEYVGTCPVGCCCPVGTSTVSAASGDSSEGGDVSITPVKTVSGPACSEKKITGFSFTGAKMSVLQNQLTAYTLDGSESLSMGKTSEPNILRWVSSIGGLPATGCSGALKCLSGACLYTPIPAQPLPTKTRSPTPSPTVAEKMFPWWGLLLIVLAICGVLLFVATFLVIRHLAYKRRMRELDQQMGYQSLAELAEAQAQQIMRQGHSGPTRPYP